MPLIYHPIYKRYNTSLPNVKKTWKELVSLPLFTEIKDTELNFILGKIKQFDNNYDNF